MISGAATEADEIRSIGANDTVKRVLIAALSEVLGLARVSAGLELRIKVPVSPVSDLGHLPDLDFTLVKPRGQRSEDAPLSPFCW